MRILVIHNFLWAHYKNSLYEELAAQATAQGHTLLVIQLALNERSRAAMPNNAPRPNYPFKVLHEGFIEEVSNSQLIKLLMAELRTFRPDVVNLTGFYSAVHWRVMAYCKLHGIPMILSNDSTLADNPNKGVKALIKKTLMQQFSGYFVYGKRAADYITYFGGKPEKIWVKRSAVVANDNLLTLAEAHPTSEALPPLKYIIFVGRLLKIKGIDDLLEAFRALQSNYSDWGLLLVGEGEERKHIEQLKANYNLPVFLVGGKSWQQVPAYLVKSEILVLPSHSEPWGLVANEAMVCGKPVIISNACGSVELVENGETGLAFEAGNVKDLAEKLEKLMANDALRASMGAAAQQHIRQYSPQQVAKQMIQGFEQIK